MNTGSLPTDQAELDEFARLMGQHDLLNELDEMFDSDEFETFYQSPASKLLSPWFDAKQKQVNDRLLVLAELIKQRYEV